MKTLSVFERTALVAVLLFVVACGGDDDSFEPAPGATLGQDQLEGLIDAAVADFDLTKRSVQPEPLADASGGLRSCFEVESGPCSVPSPPGLAASFEGENGTRALVRLTLGVDELEAGDLLRSAAQSRSLESTAGLRIFYESAPVPATRAIGPCRQGADWATDEGCAWQDRDAPNVGDDARAMKSDSLQVTRLSAVAFSRAFVFADVQVISSDGKVPNGLADDIGKALDEQIKAAISQ